mmetsp:Transcript_26587/g.44373  ORF Transcript_26587/g.44373 Transcript_26587/m.44373 type:complete len:102 (+) Transcript_26587:529-834(+)
MCFNTCYFSHAETVYLTGQTLFDGRKLGVAFTELLEESLRNNGTICTSSEGSPFLRRAFQLSKEFREDKQLKKVYKEFNENWRKQHKKYEHKKNRELSVRA